jgi:hypothetical protein
MHIDVLLAGLRRLVVDGVYDDSADAVASAMRTANKRAEDDDRLDEALRAALYGAGDPYTRAGDMRFVSANLSIADARAFRSRYYAPDNATLIISGRFDVALATRWADYLFGSWRGTAQHPARASLVAQAPAALALARNASLIDVAFALPARAGRRAQRLVAAELLNEVVGDVRHRLGATYGVNAALLEQARGDMYVVSGLVDPARAADAFTLMRDELSELQRDGETAARAFVTARRRVVIKLRGVATNPREASGRIATDIDLGRAPMSDLAAAREVAALTIDDMRDALSELDLSRGVVTATGPQPAIEAAFAALGRVPTFMPPASAFELDDPFANADETTSAEHRQHRTADDVEDALTDQPPLMRSRFTVMLGGGLTYASANRSDNIRVKPLSCCNGAGVDAFIGYRIDASKAVGLQLSLADISGKYTINSGFSERPLGLIPIGIGVGIQLSGYERLWASLAIGLQLDRVIEPDPDSTMDPKVWHTALGFGLLGGVDVVRFGGHRLALYGLVDGAPSGTVGYGGLTLGLGYRYY